MRIVHARFLIALLLLAPTVARAQGSDKKLTSPRQLWEKFLDLTDEASKSDNQATKEALREGRVDALLLSRGFRERDGDLVDRFVGTAFDQGALVEELSADGAGRLDEEGEGVGARLRYVT